MKPNSKSLGIPFCGQPTKQEQQKESDCVCPRGVDGVHLFHAAQFIHGALVAVHAVLCQVEVCRVLRGERTDAVRAAELEAALQTVAFCQQAAREAELEAWKLWWWWWGGSIGFNFKTAYISH